jgi:hypothetical protein
MKKKLFSRSIALLCLTAALSIVGSDQLEKQFNRPSYSDQQATETNAQLTVFPETRYVFDDSNLALRQSLQDVRYQELRESIKSFLASLDKTQRAAVVIPFNNPFRTRSFCYVLARCKDELVGLKMSALNSTQKIALNNVLMKSLSGSGYSRAIQTMNREWLVEEMENAYRANPQQYPTVGSPLVPEWTPPAKRGAPDYYIAFFGQPASMNPWGLRFEGHHLSLNLTFGGEGQQHMVGTSPMFFGSSPMIIPASPKIKKGQANPYPRWHQEEGQQSLNREAWLARSFLNALDAPTLKPGKWSTLPDVVLAGGTDVPLDASSYLKDEKVGIAVADLSALQQDLLYEFALEFLQLQASQNIDIDDFKANLADSRVWWFGNKEDDQATLYFRIQSDRYLIELLQSNTFGVSSEIESNHVHASFRDLTNDWDHDSLGAHLRQYHHEAALIH